MIVPSLTPLSPSQARTHRGFVVSTCTMPHVPAPVLAIFGRNKVTALDACIEAAVHGAEARNAVDEMRPAFASMMLASALLHGSGNVAPTWPVVGSAGEFSRGRDGRLDRRTFRRLVAPVDRAELHASEDEDDSAAFADDAVPRVWSQTELAGTVELARWNVPVREYGDASDDEVLHLAVSLAADCLPTSGPLRQTYRTPVRAWIGAHIERAVANRSDAAIRSLLAPLRHLVASGWNQINENLPTIYRAATEDLAELDACQLLPGSLHAALVDAAPINALLYLDSLGLGGEVALWQPQRSSIDPGRLVLPTILGTAVSWYGRDWWPGLMKAVYAGDTAEVVRKTVELRRLGLLVAIRRGTLGVAQRDRATGEAAPEMVSYDEDDDESKKPRLSDTLAAPEPGKDPDDVFARILAALGDDRCVRAALLKFLHDKTLAEIGKILGVQKSQADNLANQGLQRLRDHPGIEDLIGPT